MENVEFAPGGAFAFRPGQILVPAQLADQTESVLRRFMEDSGSKDYSPARIDPDRPFGFAKFTGTFPTLAAIHELRLAGIPAQPNHLLFATCGCGCPEHPASPNANPFYANPFYANPFYANPFYANPFYANPFYANPNPGGLQEIIENQRRESSARPVASGPELKNTSGAKVRVTVLDTGASQTKWAPAALTVNGLSDDDDEPDGDIDGYLDAAAGHGTFIAGIIQQRTSVCDVTVRRVLSSDGVGDEDDIAAAIAGLVGAAKPPHLINLSFGGYSQVGMRQLEAAITAAITSGIVVVASAGNDGTCAPLYPAAFPGVVGVAALDEKDSPASFSNYGPWVRACTLGVDVVSSFFTDFDGDEIADGTGDDPDEFVGWAVWSGTSFAAPRVVAALAETMASRAIDGPEAVRRLIDHPDRVRMPSMGSIVQPSGDNWFTVRTVSEHK